jgi:hypothetical protein
MEKSCPLKYLVRSCFDRRAIVDSTGVHQLEGSTEMHSHSHSCYFIVSARDPMVTENKLNKAELAAHKQLSFDNPIETANEEKGTERQLTTDHKAYAKKQICHLLMLIIA